MHKKRLQIITIISLGLIIGSLASALNIVQLILFSVGIGSIVGIINYIIFKQ